MTLQELWNQHLGTRYGGGEDGAGITSPGYDFPTNMDISIGHGQGTGRQILRGLLSQAPVDFDFSNPNAEFDMSWLTPPVGGDEFGGLPVLLAALGAYGVAGAGGGLPAATSGMTEAGWGFGPAGLGGDAAGAAAAATGGGAEMAWNADPRFAGTTVDGVVQPSGDLADWWAQDSSADWMSQWEGGTPEVGTPTPNSSGWPNLPPGMSQLLGSILGPAAGSLFGNGNSLFAPTGTGGLDWGKILGGLIGYKMTDDLADKYFTKAGEIADKYKRPWDEWLPIARQMRDDPQGYMNQYWKPMIGQFTDEAARKAAAGGFNNSGSGVNQIADTVTNRSMQSIFNPNYDANLKAAGLYQSPSTAAGIEGDLTSKGLGVVNQANSNLGFAAREATSGLFGGSRQSTDDIYNNIMKTFFS